MNTFRASMAWLHTWSGLLLGWVLYFVFVTGTVAYFDTEIGRWMQPDLPKPLEIKRRAAAFGQAADYLEERAPDAERWFIRIPMGRSYSYYPFVSWRGAGSGSGNVRLDPFSGAALESAWATHGAQRLYQMHYRLHYMPWQFGQWIVGVATMFMLVALISGVIIHRRIFRDFFTFRPGKGQRSWLDAHNLLSVVTLPYQFMITYSGLVILMAFYMPLIVFAQYGVNDQGEIDEAALYQDLDPYRALMNVEAAGERAPLVSVAAIVELGDRVWADDEVRFLQIYHPGDAHARIAAGYSIDDTPVWSTRRLVFDGVSGELLHRQPKIVSNAQGAAAVFYGLHEALFAGSYLRWLFFLSGLMGAAMVATGLVLWTVKRRQRLEKGRAAPERGLRLVERLNVATIAGLPIAIAAYFWANRLLPVDWPARADWEVHTMFLTWLALFVNAALRPAARAWREQAMLGAAAFGLLPVVNVLTTERHLGHSLPAGDWVFAGFDLTMLAIGLAFAVAAWGLRRWAPAEPPARTDRSTGAVEAGAAR